MVATDQPNLVVHNSVAPSLHSNCAHQINFVKLNLKCPPPPSFSRTVYHYARANSENFKKCLQQFDWTSQIGSIDNPSEQVNFFDETFLNVANNFIPHNEKKFFPRDPPWFTKPCRALYNQYHRKFSRYAKRGYKPEEKPAVDALRDSYAELVSKEKDTYLSNLGSKVSDPRTGVKKYWTCLKRLLNNKSKSCIPPILDNGIFITDIKQKCILFNSFFHKQCTIFETTSNLPLFQRKTQKSLKSIEITPNQITKYIRMIQAHKAHGFDGISAKMLRLADNSITLPLSIIYKNCLSKGVFPNKWKKANVIPVYKKNEKNLTTNYRPISLLPLCGKIFEKIIYDSLYTYINENKFISDDQSGYRRGDSTIKQLITITNEIHKTFDQGNELRAVFLDISKAFDRVWHEGLIFKLKQLGIECEAIAIIESFLKDRVQRVTIDGQISDWQPIAAGVPQGSILGPLLFLVYINDLSEVVKSNVKIFADDTFIYRVVDSNSTQDINEDLASITRWAWQWKFQFNPTLKKQAVEILFSNKSEKSTHLPLIFNGIPVKKVSETMHLGVKLDESLSYKSHLEEKIAKSNQIVGCMIQLKKWLAYHVLEVIYKLYVRPNLDYGDVLYHKENPKKGEISYHEDDPVRDEKVFEFSSKVPLLQKVEEIQYKAARIITGAWQSSPKRELYKILGWESLNQRRILRKLTILHETLINKHPSHLFEIIKSNIYPNDSRLGGRLLMKEIHCKKMQYHKEFLPSTIKDWNFLDFSIRESKTKAVFKQKLLNAIRPKKSPYFGLFSNAEVRYLTMLRLKLSPLNAHKSHHNFQNIDEFCTVCGCTESTEHYLLSCPSYRLSRTIMFTNISRIMNEDVSILPPSVKVELLLYGKKEMTFDQNTLVLKETAKFIKKSKRLDSM